MRKSEMRMRQSDKKKQKQKQKKTLAFEYEFSFRQLLSDAYIIFQKKKKKGGLVIWDRAQNMLILR